VALCKSLKKNCKCGWNVGYGKRQEKCPDCGADLHCGNDAVSGYSVCSKHGGPSPTHNFYGQGTLVNGTKSQFPITRLASTYNKMQKDGRVLSNRAAIEVIDTRIRQLADRIDLNDAPDRLARLYMLWGEYSDALAAGATIEILKLRGQLDAEFERANTDYAAWRQMFDGLDLRRKMVESEVKVLKEIHAIMTAEDAYELTGKLLAAVMRVVEDPRKMKQVQYEFTRIIGESGDNAGKGFGGEDWGGGGEEDVVDGPGEMDREEFLHPGDEERSETEG
jgi:hypothetical protein